MIICESQFDQPDPKMPDYSYLEVDYYAWIPLDSSDPKRVSNHRLSLRKNLKTREYEVYRHYYMRLFAVKSSIFVFSDKHAIEDVGFKSKVLREAIGFANGEVERFHEEREMDVICRHVLPIKSRHCAWSEV